MLAHMTHDMNRNESDIMGTNRKTYERQRILFQMWTIQEEGKKVPTECPIAHVQTNLDVRRLNSNSSWNSNRCSTTSEIYVHWIQFLVESSSSSSITYLHYMHDVVYFCSWNEIWFLFLRKWQSNFLFNFFFCFCIIMISYWVIKRPHSKWHFGVR